MIGVGGFFWSRREKTVEVEALKITRGEIERVIRVTGKLVGEDEDRVFASLGGKVVTLPRKEGEWVNKGEMILEYDQMALKSAVERAQTNLAASQKAEEDLIRSAPIESKLQAARDLVNAKKIIYDQAQTDYVGDPTPAHRETLNTTLVAYRDAVAALEALERTNPTQAALNSVSEAVKSAQASLREAEENLKKTKTIAHRSGFLIYENTAAVPKVGFGSVTTAGQLIFSLFNPERLKFAAEIDEDDISQINHEAIASIKLDAGDRVLEGKVSSIDQSLTTTESGAKVFLTRLILTKTEKDLRGGMKGEATFVLEARKGILRVPIEAVFDEEDKNIVYINDDGQAKKAEIVLGLENDEYYEVKSGLNEGDEVLVGSKVKEVKSGSKIKIAP